MAVPQDAFREAMKTTIVPSASKEITATLSRIAELMSSVGGDPEELNECFSTKIIRGKTVNHYGKLIGGEMMLAVLETLCERFKKFSAGNEAERAHSVEVNRVYRLILPIYAELNEHCGTSRILRDDAMYALKLFLSRKNAKRNFNLINELLANLVTATPVFARMLYKALVDCREIKVEASSTGFDTSEIVIPSSKRTTAEAVPEPSSASSPVPVPSFVGTASTLSLGRLPSYDDSSDEDFTPAASSSRRSRRRAPAIEDVPGGAIVRLH
jgi:hypothetical protein